MRVVACAALLSAAAGAPGGQLSGAPGRRLGAHCGYSCRNRLLNNTVDRPAPPQLLAQLRNESAAEERAGTAMLSQPSARNCTLRFMRDRLHLYSFFNAAETTLLGHWLRHYIDGLGVSIGEK